MSSPMATLTMLVQSGQKIVRSTRLKVIVPFNECELAQDLQNHSCKFLLNINDLGFSGGCYAYENKPGVQL